MEEQKEFDFNCSCGCSKLAVCYYKWDDGDMDVSIMHYTMSFGERQRPIREGFKRMFKLIWCAITGKEYCFYDLTINKDRLEEFKKWVAEL